MKSLIKIGSRGSALALYQTELVRSTLSSLFPLVTFEIVRIKTKGDMIRRGAIHSLGRGIFTGEIEEALLRKEIDLAVHSAKDLETLLPAGLAIGGFLEREDARDCLVSKNRVRLKDFPPNAQIGTSSPRRAAFLRRLRGDIQICGMRGNVDTRLRKIEGGECDGTVLAYAGLKRLGLADKVAEIFAEEAVLPQPGQGAIAIEFRADDSEMKELAGPVNHWPTFFRVSAERSFLGRLEGGCQVPVGIRSSVEQERLVLTGAVCSLDGAQFISDSIVGKTSESLKLGAALADRLLEKGARSILDGIRHAEKT